MPSGHRTVLSLRIEAPDFATRRASTTELREADPRIESRDFATTKMGIYSTKSRTDRLLATTTCLRSSLVATNRGQRVPPDPSGRLLRRMSQSPFVCRSGGQRLCGPRRGTKPWWTRTSQEIPVPLCVSKRRPTPNPRGLRRGGETLQPNCYTQAVLGWLPGCNGPHNKRPNICSGRCTCSRLSARMPRSPQ